MPDHPYCQAIAAALAEGTPAASLVEGRIYADQLPNDEQLPSVRYAIVSDLPHQRLRSGENVTADVQFDVYADRADAANAWAIDRSLRRALDRVNLAAEGFIAIHCMCMERGTPFKEPGYYRITSRYRLYGSAA